jgi:hypothetical protein
MYDSTEKYRGVRGFNFQPDWSSNGINIWLKFNPIRYRELIKNGKEKFPKLNTLRIWLSFDAWCEDRDTYLENVKKAGRIITEEGLSFIPVYFNGWFGIPSFGGFAPEVLKAWCTMKEKNSPYHRFIRESAAVFSDASVLIHDICNEPLNNVHGNRTFINYVFEFLKEMSMELKSNDNRPVTIGSQGYVNMIDNESNIWSDIDLFAPIVDVISLHPYCIPPETKEQHKENIKNLIQLINKLEKPTIITECCWGGITDEERIVFLEIEIPHYVESGIGFCCHALSDSPVADLHPLDDGKGLGLYLYLAFINKHGMIRKGHDIFNKL